MSILRSIPDYIELVDQRGTGAMAVIRRTRVPLSVVFDFLDRGLGADEVARILGLPPEYAGSVASLTRADRARVRRLEQIAPDPHAPSQGLAA